MTCAHLRRPTEFTAFLINHQNHAPNRSLTHVLAGEVVISFATFGLISVPVVMLLAQKRKNSGGGAGVRLLTTAAAGAVPTCVFEQWKFIRSSSPASSAIPFAIRKVASSHVS